MARARADGPVPVADLWSVLRAVTPLEATRRYGSWASAPWARALADAMGEIARSHETPYEAWPEWELARGLHAQSVVLPDGMSIDAAIDRVGRGLMAYYWTMLDSTVTDGERSAATTLHGMAAQPLRDLQERTAFAEVREQPWMLVLAVQMLYFATGSDVVDDLWPYAKFEAALEGEGLSVPEAFGRPDDPQRLARAVDHVAETLKRLAPATRQKPEWFAANIEGPMNRRLGWVMFGSTSRDALQEAQADGLEFWARSLEREEAGLLTYAAMDADLSTAVARLRAEAEEMTARSVAAQGASESATDDTHRRRAERRARAAQAWADVLAGAAVLADDLRRDAGEGAFSVASALRAEVEWLRDLDATTPVTGPATHPRVVDAALAAGRVPADSPDFAGYCEAIAEELLRCLGYSLPRD